MSDAPRILVVDDEEAPLQSLAGLLRSRGYEVVATRSPLEALEVAAKQDFAVVISDQQMPEMPGLDLLQAFCMLQPHSSRMLVTGVLSLEMVVEAVHRGEIFRFIAKPWMRAEMVGAVETAVQRYQILTENARLHEEANTLNELLAEANRRLQGQVGALEKQNAEIEASREALRSNLDRSLELCARIIAAFDPVLGQQTRATVKLCEAMAAAEQFSPEDKHVLMVSAWLHDIGLMGAPREAVKSLWVEPAMLPEDLHRVVCEHPIYGQTLASFVDSLQSVGDTIRSHHERFDGTGYPDGLARESIPWMARCLAVADFYAASSATHDQTVEYILALSGTAFDPEAVRIFLRTAQAQNSPRPYREVTVAELQPGMRLARGIYSPTGLLLMAEGQRLDAAIIAKLRKHNALSSLPQQLFVLA